MPNLYAYTIILRSLKDTNHSAMNRHILSAFCIYDYHKFRNKCIDQNNGEHFYCIWMANLCGKHHAKVDEDDEDESISFQRNGLTFGMALHNQNNAIT